MSVYLRITGDLRGGGLVMTTNRVLSKRLNRLPRNTWGEATTSQRES